ncbi:type II secretion system minor pseudopilin GspK [Acinetobacter larvae]|uniref:Type II secretion system protein K n=1 Tax=Acinetobacter larvae TaxID=1789224 RepID=A0A1B2LYG4_9GAMM|nr:type II secretion system minor pseudopilin GspK [Acinetobacter larvae]AOA57965.1 general secretion pathway protein GspK [Acinetobacter larvae]
MPNLKSQRGIALITILVMVALATILAATIAKQQRISAENVMDLQRQNQMLAYMKSAESFAIELLRNSSKQNGADHVLQTWAQPLAPMPIEGGVIRVQLTDLNGRFNLNSLLKEDGMIHAENLKIFEQLLQRVGLPASLSQAVIDWQDADDESSGAMGAENAYYRGLSQPYLAANHAFIQVEQLRLVRGFEGERYALIAPYVTALPVQDQKININTASAVLLASLDEKLNVDQIEQMQQSMKANLKHFKSVDELWQQSAFQQLSPEAKTLAAALFDVKSNFFQTQVMLQFDQRQRYLYSTLMRKGQQTHVYARQISALPRPM